MCQNCNFKVNFLHKKPTKFSFCTFEKINLRDDFLLKHFFCQLQFSQISFSKILSNLLQVKSKSSKNDDDDEDDRRAQILKTKMATADISDEKPQATTKPNSQFPTRSAASTPHRKPKKILETPHQKQKEALEALEALEHKVLEEQKQAQPKPTQAPRSPVLKTPPGSTPRVTPPASLSSPPPIVVSMVEESEKDELSELIEEPSKKEILKEAAEKAKEKETLEKKPESSHETKVEPELEESAMKPPPKKRGRKPKVPQQVLPEEIKVKAEDSIESR